jgi:hypothetical protein
MFDGILQKFADQAPGAVMVRALLEHLLNAERLDAWFERTRGSQYTRKILFSSLVGLLLQVVCRTQASVHAAYGKATIAASIVAVYGKLRGVALATSQARVRDIARESAQLIEGLQGSRPPLLPGYRIKYLDGNCVEASARRLKPLCESAAAALPGKSLVVFDQALDLVDDVFPCADGHAQERALLGLVSATVAAQDLWVADRNFCVLNFLLNIERAAAPLGTTLAFMMSVIALSAPEMQGAQVAADRDLHRCGRDRHPAGRLCFQSRSLTSTESYT